MGTFFDHYKNTIIQYLNKSKTDVLINKKDLLYLIKRLQEEGVFIESVMWWEHKLRNQSSAISYGGPIDLQNNKYIWGECCGLAKWFDGEDIIENKREVLNYIQDVENDKTYDGLYPSISIRK